MANINNVVLNGRIVSDLELRYTNNKKIPVTNFRLQHSNPKLKYPVYIDVEVWGKEAENLVESGQRGSFVVVYAELRRDVWAADDGGNRSKLKLTAQNVIVDKGYVGRSNDKPEAANISF